MTRENTQSSMPGRGFPAAEFEQRLARAQRAMHALRLDALFLTTEHDVRYFSGFDSPFWHSPTRCWYLVLPASGPPVAVIPEIGAAGMAGTWVRDIRTWAAPNPADDGISVLAEALTAPPARHGRIGAMLGYHSHLRMPQSDFAMLENLLPGRELVDCAALLLALRQIKSPLEIEKIRCVCQLASGAFEALPAALAAGMTERGVARAMRMDLLARDADDVPYLVCASGRGGYTGIIMNPTDRELAEGDLLVIDTGAVRDGYFCDFDRNFAFAHADDATRAAYREVYAATDAGFAAARPGNTVAEVWRVMWAVLEAGGALGNSVGRMGHGLGAQLTETPSVAAFDGTVIEPGMVLTLEPGMLYGPDRLMVHEENIVITEHGAEWLTRRAAPELPVIG